MLGQVGAVEAHRLVGISSVIIVPVEQRRRRFRRQSQSMHAEHAADIHFAGARKQAVAHHAHHRARHDAEILFDRSPALHGADGHFGRRHPVIDHRAELRHLHQRSFGHAAGIHVFLDRSQLGLRSVVVVLHALDAAEHFGKIERLDRDALRFQNLLAVADGIESGGPRANRSHAQVAEAIHHAADRRRTIAGLWRIPANPELSVCSVVIEYGMPYCLRLLQADIFPQKLSRRNAMVIFLGSSGVA